MTVMLKHEFPTPDDINAIRGVILAQLAAFADDDAELAFSFASSAIRRRFGTAEPFLEMVRNHYPVVHGARRADFRSLFGDQPARQFAWLIDAEGGRTLTCYELIREAFGWRISGCLPEGVYGCDDEPHDEP